jgi:hypothetical protein
MDESEDFEEVIYYGIPIKFECMVDCDLQPDFYRMLFFHPEISARRAFHYVNDVFEELPHLLLTRQWRNQIKAIVSCIEREEQVLKLIERMAKKVVKWGKLFSFPIIIDIDEMAMNLNISTELLLDEMYSIMMNRSVTVKNIDDFLQFYLPYYSDRQIDYLLDRYNELKQNEEAVC